jgi:glycosyltransferase involved in cell wall biosynthesis
MNDRLPLISIGMPVFNCERTVAESVQSIVQQTYRNWELIVIDDGSSDNTVKIVSQFQDARIKIIREESNHGLAARLNEAVIQSRGEFFGRMDGDDVSYPNRFQSQLAYLLRHPQVDVLGGAILIFDGEGSPIGLRVPFLDHNTMCRRPWGKFGIPHVTWIGRTSWFRRNPYKIGARCAQDRELLLRSRCTSCFAAMEDVLVGVRELRISLKKTVPARLEFVQAMVREGIRQRCPSLLTVGVAVESTKILLDATAVWSGLEYRLLRHRIPSCPQIAKDEWIQVRDQVRASMPSQIATPVR